MKQIKVKIAPDGSTVVEATGFTNSGCKNATKPIEQALGVVTKTDNKAEAYVNEANANQATNTYKW